MPGVYISIPFCAQKCTYCNFASGVFPAEVQRSYFDALRAEIAAFQWPWTPDTVYFGGGTPSRDSADTLASVLALIPGRPWREATIEVAPGDITAEKARGWSAAGLNRVSLGVQSFIQRELSQTGRKHTPEVVRNEIAILRDAGIDEISLDLIAGLPHQTLETFAESIAETLRLDVPHVSVYMLEVDEDSRLGLEILQGGGRYGAGRIPNEDEIVTMYETAVDRLRSAGLDRYEISNFARKGHESVHNLKYWRLEPYVGFGADAHSFDGVARWQNVESANDYVDRWSRGEDVVLESTAAHIDEERLFVGLRLASGVSLLPADRARHGESIERFIAGGLMEQQGDTVRLTSRGVLVSNEVFEEFVTV